MIEAAQRVTRAFDAYEKATANHDGLLEGEETDPYRLSNSADALRESLTELREAMRELRTLAHTS